MGEPEENVSTQVEKILTSITDKYREQMEANEQCLTQTTFSQNQKQL